MLQLTDDIFLYSRINYIPFFRYIWCGFPQQSSRVIARGTFTWHVMRFVATRVGSELGGVDLTPPFYIQFNL
jgi:hypothetical protein